METLFTGIEDFFIGIISRLVLQLLFMGVIQRQVWIVPHWSLTILATLYYFIQVEPLSCLMIGFIAIDYGILAQRYFKK